ncbi:hypothetical protein KRM28CT15_04290 [Krasilnikovia sp. M28-CT-15]
MDTVGRWTVPPRTETAFAAAPVTPATLRAYRGGPLRAPNRPGGRALATTAAVRHSAGPCHELPDLPSG